MIRGINRETDEGGVGGEGGGERGVAGCTLLRVNYVCIQTLFTKKTDCLHTCFLPL